MVQLKVTFLLSILILAVSVEGGCRANISTPRSHNVLSLLSLTSKANETFHDVTAIVLGFMFEIEMATRYAFHKSIGYIAIDVCNDQETLVDILLMFLLEPNASNIYAVYSVMPFEMTKLAVSILLPYKIPFFAHTFEPMIPSQLFNSGYNVFKHDIFLKYDNKKIKARYNEWPFFLKIKVCQRDVCVWKNDTLSEVKSEKHCAKYKHVNLDIESDVKTAKEQINQTDADGVIILGDFLVVNRFGNMIQGIKKPIYSEIKIKETAAIFCKYAYLTKSNFYTLRSCDNSSISIDYHANKFFMKCMMFYLNNFGKALPQPMTSANEYYSASYNSSTYFAGLCKIPSCGNGKELVFDSYCDNNWNENFGWICRKCIGNRFKIEYDNLSCVDCPRYTKANKNKTSCFDPYTSVWIRWKNIDGVFLAMASIISTCSIMFAFSMFIYYRNTPIVLASDKTISFVQLFAQLALSVSIIPLFVGKPSDIICVLRPTIVGMLLTLSTSLTLTKTQKFLKIFQAQTRMSSKEVKMTKACEMFSTILLSSFSVVLLIVSFQSVHAKTKTIWHEQTMQRDVYCSTDWHIQMQFGYVLFLLIGTGVQAFRARKLPAALKETNVLTFSSFLSILLMVVSFGIYYSQKNPYARTLVIAVNVICLVDANFFLLYPYKTYLMIFHPEKNNPAVLRHQVLDKMTKRSNMLLTVRGVTNETYNITQE